MEDDGQGFGNLRATTNRPGDPLFTVVTDYSARLLQLSLPLVKTYGFSKEALARSVLSLDTSSGGADSGNSPPAGRTHAVPLSDTAVSALFGSGDEARRRLVEGWLEQGLKCMENVTRTSVHGAVGKVSVRDALRARLEYNEPVLGHLPEAFALLISPSSSIPPLDPLPALKHVARVADKACIIADDKSLQLDWYTRRGSLAGIYAAAELHQLTSPKTAYSFLDSLLDGWSDMKASMDEVGLYSSYIMKSWKSIIHSMGHKL